MKVKSAVTAIYFCNLLFNVNPKPTYTSEWIRSRWYDNDVFPEKRIVGGKPTTINEYPFAISVQRRYAHHFCGGSYLLPRFILTAAHCMVIGLKGRKINGRDWIPMNPYLFIAVGGATAVKSLYGSTMQVRLIDKIMPHPQYGDRSSFNDIGIYRLVTPFTITSFLYPSPIPSAYDPSLSTVKLPLCTVLGWGFLGSKRPEGSGDVLRHVQVPLVTGEMCKMYIGQNKIQPEKQICAGREEGGVDACQGDSGGPLMCDHIQVGVVSWGIGCAAPKLPGVYCRIDYYLNWINETIVENKGRINTSILLFTIFNSILCISIKSPLFI